MSGTNEETRPKSLSSHASVSEPSMVIEPTEELVEITTSSRPPAGVVARFAAMEMTTFSMASGFSVSSTSGQTKLPSAKTVPRTSMRDRVRVMSSRPPAAAGTMVMSLTVVFRSSARIPTGSKHATPSCSTRSRCTPSDWPLSARSKRRNCGSCTRAETGLADATVEQPRKPITPMV
jgi:hypothetical protein